MLNRMIKRIYLNKKATPFKGMAFLNYVDDGYLFKASNLAFICLDFS